MTPPFITRVRLNDYRSIAECDVELGSLTFLVGPNGSGKSNFLDALRFVAEGLRDALDHALRRRGGINEVRRRSTGHPHNLGIHLDLSLPSGGQASFSFSIGSKQGGGFRVLREECMVSSREGGAASYLVKEGEVVAPKEVVMPPAAPDRLYLVNAAGLPAFAPVYSLLTQLGAYNFNPDSMRDLQAPDSGDLLYRDGSNVASVLRRISADDSAMQQITEYLRAVVPALEGVRPEQLGPRETVTFLQKVRGASNAWQFHAQSMSDGTLRVLGILVALFQGSGNGAPKVPLVAIEEPETALHPAAASVLLEVLETVARRTQVLVTSHSPDLLDRYDLGPAQLLAVIAEQGITGIGPLDETGKRALARHLHTAGELMRMDQLKPDPASLPKQIQFFWEDPV